MRLLPILLFACTAPEMSDAFTIVEQAVVDDGPAANLAFIDLVDAADDHLRVALPGLTDPELTNALLAAHERGVDLAFVTDIDRQEESGVAALLDAGVPVQLADAGIGYFDFSINEDVAFVSDDIAMTHAFAVADARQFVMATGAGDILGGARILFEGASETLSEDLLGEHTQVFGGSDATALTAFDSMAKSIADLRWAYPTQSDEILEVWFGPQERVVKRMTDAVYGARSSIRLMSNDVADEGIIRAMQQKAADGFDVEVIVGPQFASTNGAISDILSFQSGTVEVLRAAGVDPLATLLFVDFDRAMDGRYHKPQAMMLTHPVLSAARSYSDRPVVTDQLTDGALYVLQVHGEPTAPLQELAQLYMDVRADAGAL